MHEDLGYISQNLLTKDAGQRNQALWLDVRDCALSVANIQTNKSIFFLTASRDCNFP